MKPDRPLCLLTREDVHVIAELYGRSEEYFLLQDGEPAGLSDACDLFADLPPEKTMQDQAVFGCRGLQGLDAVAAILHDYPSGGVFYLGFLLVDPAARGMGLGRSVYAAIESWAADRGACEIRLAVLDVNVSAARFWRSIGFQQRRRVGPDRFKSRMHHRIELSRQIG